MMMNDFDPYEALIQAHERLSHLEHAHNKLVRAVEKTDQELNQALQALRALQQNHLRLLMDFDQYKKTGV